MEGDALENLTKWLVLLATLGCIIGVQVMFWMPASTQSTKNTDESQSSTKPSSAAEASPSTIAADDSREQAALEILGSINVTTIPITEDNDKPAEEKEKDTQTEEQDLFAMNNQYRCVCETGFLPPGLLKSFGGAESMMRLGTGQCYHKQT